MPHTVLVTGAQGCIGAWVLKLLLEDGHDVVSFDQGASHPRLPLIAPGLDVTNLQSVVGRIEDGDAIAELIRLKGITHIVHLAAVLMPSCQKDPIGGAMINVVGTLNVFEAARKSGRDIRFSYA